MYSVTFLISLTFVVIMSKEGDLPKLPIKNRKIGTIGISVIVMGLSLLFIYILWASFGYIGPSFSSDVLNLQQSTLRAQYHLPEEPVVTDPTVLQTPPSLRQFLTDNATSGSTNATDQASDNTQVSIVPGASTLTDTAFSPSSIEVTVGQTVVWTNDDSAFHTVTSGTAGAADVGKEFDSGLTGPTALTSNGKTFEHTFDRIGDYPYFCSLHPAMVGTVIVK